MPSAPAAVQAVARYVAPPVEDEGAATIIEELVLARRSASSRTDRFAAGGAGLR